MYKILAFDGGGIRSIFTARLLQRLEKEINLISRADMLSGNSGGSIVAASIACGYTPAEIVTLFAEEGPAIFKDSLRDDVLDLFDLTGAKYESKYRYKVFEKYFGPKRLSDFNKKIVITAFDLKHESGRWQPMSFHNYHNSRYQDLSFVDAVMASTAAPTYFPVHRIGASKFADGGVWGNNPSMAALTEATNGYRGAQKIENIAILNIGTLLNKTTLKGPKNDLGVIDWVKKGVIDLLLDSGSMDAVTYYCKGLLGSRYFQLNQLTDEEIKLDDVEKIDRLIEIADNFDLSEVKSWIQGFWI